MQRANARRASFFDVDGTLMNGFLIVSFPNFLARRNLFNKKEAATINRLVKCWRAGKMTYHSLCEQVPLHYAKGLAGQKTTSIRGTLNSFLKEQKKNVFGFSPRLVKLMKTMGSAIATSGSPPEPLAALNKVLGLDEIHSSEVEARQGVYTGRLLRNMTLKEVREKILLEIARKKGLDLRACFGFGDTEQDVTILEKVGFPIAINPSKKLLAICKARGWPFFYKEQDVVAEVRKML